MKEQENKEIETYVYSKESIHQLIVLLNSVEIRGIAQAKVIAAISEIIDRPIAEGKTNI